MISELRYNIGDIIISVFSLEIRKFMYFSNMTVFEKYRPATSYILSCLLFDRLSWASEVL